MTTANDARKAHKILDDLFKRKPVLDEEREFLRSALPELPKQKTLKEILVDVESAARGVTDNYWSPSTNPQDWLWELHAQLQGLKDQPTAADSSAKPAPGLPDGMRLATHPAYGLCVVSPTTDEDGERRVFYLSTSTETGADCRWVPVSHLTFLDGETAYPGFLVGEAEYDRAPDGTVVVYKKSVPFIKWGGNWQGIMADDKPTAAEMGTIRRRVLRWGYGND